MRHECTLDNVICKSFGYCPAKLPFKGSELKNFIKSISTGKNQLQVHEINMLKRKKYGT